MQRPTLRAVNRYLQILRGHMTNNERQKPSHDAERQVGVRARSKFSSSNGRKSISEVERAKN